MNKTTVNETKPPQKKKKKTKKPKNQKNQKTKKKKQKTKQNPKECLVFEYYLKKN